MLAIIPYNNGCRNIHPPLPCMDEINQHNNEVHYVKNHLKSLKYKTTYSFCFKLSGNNKTTLTCEPHKHIYAHWVFYSIHSWCVLRFTPLCSVIYNPVEWLLLLRLVFGFFGVGAREPASQHFRDVRYCRFIIEGLHLGLHLLIIEKYIL